MFSLAWRSMGRRCSKKAVRCGAVRSACLSWLVRVGIFRGQAPGLLCAQISRRFYGFDRDGGYGFSTASTVCFCGLRSGACPSSHSKFFCTVGDVPHQILHRF